MLDEGGLSRPGVADDAQQLPRIGAKIHIHQGGVLKGRPGGIDVIEFFRLYDGFQIGHSFANSL